MRLDLFRTLVVFLCGLALPGCTEPNAAAKCGAGTCSDPAYPYCDSDGTVSGEPGSCIAVNCEPGSILTCLEDDAFTCTTDGTAYERVSCDLGCSTSPNPHCKYIEPRYLPDVCDTAASNEQLAITNSGTFDPNLDSNCTGGVVEQTGAPAICVVRYREIIIETDVVLTVLGPSSGLPGRPIAFVADQGLRIRGTLDIAAKMRISGPGGSVLQSGSPANVNNSVQTGGGGAGGRTAGASGGSPSQNGGAGNGGIQAVDPAFLASFLGGAAAGQLRTETEAGGGGGGGGAAMLISCHGSVEVTGTISAGGGGGQGGVSSLFAIPGWGGGAGGYVVLQAKEILVTGQLFANGGSAGAGMRESGAAGANGVDGKLSATSYANGGIPQFAEGAGGHGGVGTTPPTAGGKPTMTPANAGGGGGSVGFFQTYSPSGREPTLTPSAISPPFQPSGMIMTR